VDAAVIAHAATAACAIACAVLVAAEWRGPAALRAAAKLAASAAFLVVAAGVGGGQPFDRWILAGLACGAAGDAFLLGRGDRMFLAGLVAFLLGHLAYVAGLAQLVPAGRWLPAAGAYAAPPIAAGLAALAWLWPRLGALRGPVIVYIAAITAMVVGAIAAHRAGALPAPQRSWLAAGAALFFVSDLAVARDRFVARGLANRLWGLPAYYAGQLLIAWSIS
jgi:uncharacterized membrane protein YhhN